MASGRIEFLVRVFTYYDPDFEPEPAGPIIRLWELSWRAHGWEPRLLIPRLARRHPDFRADGTYWEHFALAMRTQKEPGSCVDYRTFNNGLRPEDSAEANPASMFPKKGLLVRFTPEHSLADMLTLGPYAIGKRASTQ